MFFVRASCRVTSSKLKLTVTKSCSVNINMLNGNACKSRSTSGAAAFSMNAHPNIQLWTHNLSINVNDTKRRIPCRLCYKWKCIKDDNCVLANAIELLAALGLHMFAKICIGIVMIRSQWGVSCSILIGVRGFRNCCPTARHAKRSHWNTRESRAYQILIAFGERCKEIDSNVIANRVQITLSMQRFSPALIRQCIAQNLRLAKRNLVEWH